jgi:hypothetical protein
MYMANPCGLACTRAASLPQLQIQIEVAMLQESQLPQALFSNFDRTIFIIDSITTYEASKAIFQWYSIENGWYPDPLNVVLPALVITMLVAAVLGSFLFLLAQIAHFNVLFAAEFLTLPSTENINIIEVGTTLYRSLHNDSKQY